MNEEYHYFMLSEYVDDQSYLPLYASYQNEGGMHFPSYAGKFGLVDDGSVSEEEAVWVVAGGNLLVSDWYFLFGNYILSHYMSINEAIYPYHVNIVINSKY